MVSRMLTRREGAGGKFSYELVYAVAAGEAHASLAGLIEIDALRQLATTTTAKSRGEAPEVAGRLRGDSGLIAGRLRVDESAQTPHPAGVSGDSSEIDGKPHVLRSNTKTPSYPQTHAPLAALYD